MSETLTADKGIVLTAYEKAKGKRKIFLENLFGMKTFQPDIMKRINSFEDVCKEMGRNPKDYICTSDDPDEQMANATKKALLNARCFNEGVELDWSNDQQLKYLMILKFTPGSGWSLFDVDGWDTYTFCGARLHFANPDHARHCFKIMPEVYITINNQYPNNEKN